MTKTTIIIILLTMFYGHSQSQSVGKTSKLTEESLDYYCNSRFQFCIRYPDNIFTAKLESDSGDGCTFSNADSEAVLRVFGRNREVTLPLRKQLEINRSLYRSKGFTISYVFIGKNYFVLSGSKRGQLIYEKVLLKNGNWILCQCTMPSAQKALFIRLSSWIYSSLA